MGIRKFHPIVLIAFVCATVLAIGTQIHIGSISYDKESKKVKLAYDTGYRSVTATDSGPILLCAINRLLKQKYKFNSGLTDGQTVSRDDLAIFNHAAYLLAEDGGDALRGAVKAYMANNSIENGNKVFESLVNGMKERLKDHKTDFEDVSEGPSAVTSDLKERLGKLNKKIETLLDGKSESELDEDEKKIVRKLKRERLGLEEQIADAKPEKKVEKGSESPVRWSICLNESLVKGRSVYT